MIKERIMFLARPLRYFSTGIVCRQFVVKWNKFREFTDASTVKFPHFIAPLLVIKDNLCPLKYNVFNSSLSHVLWTSPHEVKTLNAFYKYE